MGAVTPRDGSGDIPVINKLTDDPMFIDPANGDITIGNTAYLAGATDGGIIGATYWHPDYVDELIEIKPVISSTLDSLFINGHSIASFSADLHEYGYNLLISDTTILITGVPTDPEAFVHINYPLNLKGTEEADRTSSIVVTASDSSSQTTYYVLFDYLSDDAQLSALSVDNKEIHDFIPTNNYYLYKLPAGSTEVPDVGFVRNHPGASVITEPATNVNGELNERQTKFWVTAEDGEHSEVYTIEFYVMSDDATLKSLAVNGVAVNDFLPTQTFYQLNINADNTSSLTLSYKLSNDSASAIVIGASDLFGDAEARKTKIQVTAEDTNFAKEYIVQIDVLAPINSTTKKGDLGWFYPSVSSTEIFITNTNVKSTICIYSVTGQVVLHQQIEPGKKGSVLISAIPSGVYTVQLTSENCIRIGKLIKR